MFLKLRDGGVKKLKYGGLETKRRETGQLIEFSGFSFIIDGLCSRP
jgi:hypothetical protein